jgi:catechol 2,3-dioxygenase-like lactoylglutathione lyase family enzyme
VLADPEGNELCVFAPAPDEPTALVADAVDEEASAAWWADVLGATLSPAPEGRPRWLRDVPGLPYDVWKFVGVPEAKTVKNRWHWDIVCDDVDALVSKGATLLRGPDDDISWHVLADPEGNEFCAMASD